MTKILISMIETLTARIDALTVKLLQLELDLRASTPKK